MGQIDTALRCWIHGYLSGRTRQRIATLVHSADDHRQVEVISHRLIETLGRLVEDQQ